MDTVGAPKLSVVGTDKLPRPRPLTHWVIWIFFIYVGLALGLSHFQRLAEIDSKGIAVAISKPPTWDFTNLWYGGRLALEGRIDTLFDVDDYREGLRALFAPYIEDSEWSYPPTLLLIAVPLALLPLYTAYFVWSVGTLAFLTVLLRRAGLPLLACCLLWISPGAMQNALLGQNGALTAFLLFGGLLAARNRPVLAGLCFALLTIKPHLGLLVPVCLAAAGAWRAIFWSAFFAMLLASLTVICFGISAWTGFFTTTQPLMQTIMEAPFGQPYHARSITVFVSARWLGLSVINSYLAQGLAMLSAAIMAWMLWRKQGTDPLLRVGATGVLTLVATPYGYSYDMVMLSAAVLIVVLRGRCNWDIALVPVWLWPAVTHGFNTEIAPISPLALTYAAVICTWIAMRSIPLKQGEGSVLMSNAVPAMSKRQP